MLRLKPPRLALGLGLLILLASGLIAGCGPLLDPLAAQERTTLPAEQLSVGHTLGQTFVASQPRLTAVELPLAVYPAGEGDEEGELIIALREAAGNGIATTRLPIAGLQHNARYRLAFAPQPDSRGRKYHLAVEATTTSPARATVWIAGDDAYVDGSRYVDGEPAAGDLAFRAFYDYDLLWLVADLTTALATRGWLFVPALALLLLPGLAVHRWLLPDLKLDAAESLGLWLGLSVAIAPLLLLAVTLLGGRLAPASVAGLALVAGTLSLAGVATRTRPRAEDLAGLDGAGARPTQAASVVRALQQRVLDPATGAFLVAGGALALRYVHAKDLALPMWVDSIHHTLIARLIAETGRVPVDYGPFMPPQPFTYHFGFHTQVAFLHWLTGMDLAQGVLFVGQLLGGLVVFPTYLLASHLIGDRRAGLVAALIVGLVSTMPAYYVTWGRYPQLAGLIVLPAAALLASHLWRPLLGQAVGLMRRPSHSIGVYLPLAALAVAGQVLTHPRVALLLGCYIAADLLVHVARRPFSAASLARPCAAAVGLVVLSGVLLSPWLARLAQSRIVGAMMMADPTAAPGFPLGLLATGLDRYLLAGALVGAVLGLVGRRRYTIVVLGWVGLSYLAANPHLLGLPVHLMLGNDALAIALFLPIAVLNASLAVQALAWLRFDAWPRAARLAAVVPLVAAAVIGGSNLAGIVNPVCLLTTAADVEALRWVETNTPESAGFLINSRLWQGKTHVGTDGGYWLPALANRRASLPPLGYDHAAEVDVRPIRELAEFVQSEPRPSAAELHPVLLAEGLTHVFIGSRGGPLHRELFVDAPGYRLAFTNGRAWVFEVVP